MATGPTVDLNDELYAINWFDLKHPRLYDYYNRLAYPHVTSVGGKLHFKGSVHEKLKGPAENDRQMLLIVSYPGAESFLKMLGNRMFLLKSVLRIKSVDYFTFGFTRRMGETPAPSTIPKPYRGDATYLLHHFQTRTTPSESLYELVGLASKYEIGIHFAGSKAALIGREAPGKTLRTQPFLMDGLLLMECSDRNQRDELFNDQAYTEVTQSHISNNTCTLSRKL